MACKLLHYLFKFPFHSYLSGEKILIGMKFELNQKLFGLLQSTINFDNLALTCDGNSLLFYSKKYKPLILKLKYIPLMSFNSFVKL